MSIESNGNGQGVIGYSGEVTSTFVTGDTTVITIKGKIRQIIEEEMIQETSAFLLKRKDGRVEQVTSDESPALYNEDGSERVYDEDEFVEVTRVESAQAA